MDLFVSPTFRDAFLHGGLDARWMSEPERELKAAFLIWVLREAKRDINGFVVGQRGARAIRGWDPDAPRNDAAVGELLVRLNELLGDETFNRDSYVPPSSLRKARARTVSDVQLPDALWAAATYEREHGAADSLVHVLTGTPYAAKRDGKRLRELALKAATGRRAPDTPAETAALIEYLHARPVRAFSDRVSKTFASAAEQARKETDEDVRRATLHVIGSLRRQPLPVYTTTQRTQRTVPHGEGLATAPTWVRWAILDDCIEVDMSSAQLALVAALWDVSTVRAFLNADMSFWAELAAWLHTELPTGRYDSSRDFERLKRLLKVATYGICFGMTEQNVARWKSPWKLGPKEKADRRRDRAFVARAFGVTATAVGKRLLAHPLVADLLDARERRMARVLEEGSLTDVFGRTYVLGAMLGKKEVTERSALAAEAQAAEHFVMLRAAKPFVDEAARASAGGPRVYPEAEILLWQADGFTIRARQKGREDRWVSEAGDGLQAGCRELERLLGCPTVHTHLDVKHAPGLA